MWRSVRLWLLLELEIRIPALEAYRSSPELCPTRPHTCTNYRSSQEETDGAMAESSALGQEAIRLDDHAVRVALEPDLVLLEKVAHFDPVHGSSTLA